MEFNVIVAGKIAFIMHKLRHARAVVSQLPVQSHIEGGNVCGGKFWRMR
jgi:hypothetical protein